MVYQYDGENITTVISQSYTQLLLADLTGKKDTTDLVLALPENEMGGVTLQLLTNVDGEFRSIQTLALGAGSYNGCAACTRALARMMPPAVMDAWADGNAMVSDIILYDAESGSLQPYHPPGLSDPQRSTLRYHTELLSRDIDGNGTVDIPAEIDDGGDLDPGGQAAGVFAVEGLRQQQRRQQPVRRV